MMKREREIKIGDALFWRSSGFLALTVASIESHIAAFIFAFPSSLHCLMESSSNIASVGTLFEKVITAEKEFSPKRKYIVATSETN